MVKVVMIFCINERWPPSDFQSSQYAMITLCIVTLEQTKIKTYERCQNNQGRNFNIVYLYYNSKLVICINSRWPLYYLQIITVYLIHIGTMEMETFIMTV